jgi:hypothetical protein
MERGVIWGYGPTEKLRLRRKLRRDRLPAILNTVITTFRTWLPQGPAHRSGVMSLSPSRSWRTASRGKYWRPKADVRPWRDSGDLLGWNLVVKNPRALCSGAVPEEF